MEESKESCTSDDVIIVSEDCTVDKVITENHELDEFNAEFAPASEENITAIIETGKRKHEDLLHIDGSSSKVAHIAQTAHGYNTAESIEESQNSLDSNLTEDQVLTMSQSCQAELGIPSTLVAMTTQITHEPTLLPNSIVEPRDDSVNQAWFTTKEDKNSFHGKGVKWKQGMWSKEENDILKENIEAYCKANNIDPNTIIFDMSKDDRKDFYRTIAKGIKRPLFAIYRRVLRMYDRRNYIGKYSPEEVKQLKELKEKHGNDWSTIGVAMGRSASSVKDRYRLLRENCQSGKWTQDEEERLSNAVHELSGTQAGEVVTTGISWSSVAEKVQTRSEKQCRSKWLNYLNWKEKGGNEWTKQDEIKLINKIYEMDVEDENMIDWRGLMANWTSVRSPQWLRSKWWALKKHIPSDNNSFREIVDYLHINYVDTLQTKIERQESRFKNSRLPLTCHSYGSVGVRSINRQTHSSNINHTITVSNEGAVVSKEEETTQTFPNQGLQVLQLNSVTVTEGSSTQAQLQPSYIIHSMQSGSLGGQTYIIQQPALVDNASLQGEQVQISHQGVVMTTVLHPNHVRCLPEVNPELSQAIVQTEISGPIEATHLVQEELPVTEGQEQVHLASLTSQEHVIDESHSTVHDGNEGVNAEEEVVTAVSEIPRGVVAVANEPNQDPIINEVCNNGGDTQRYDQGPAAIAQSLDGRDLTSSSSQQSICVAPLSSLVTTYTAPIFTTQTCINQTSQDLHCTASSLVPNSLQNNQSSASPQSELRESAQVTHHGLANRNPDLSDSDLVPQADLPEHFLQSQVDDPVELTLSSSNSEEIVISAGVSPMHSTISAGQVVVSLRDVPMATFASPNSLMIMGQDGEECVIVEEESTH